MQKSRSSAGRVGATGGYASEQRIEAKRLIREAAHLVSMALLKNVRSWAGSPLSSDGVPNLFGLSPPGRRFVGEKPPNKLGTPTERGFFDKAIETKGAGFAKPLGFDSGLPLRSRLYSASASAQFER